MTSGRRQKRLQSNQLMRKCLVFIFKKIMQRRTKTPGEATLLYLLVVLLLLVVVKIIISSRRLGGRGGVYIHFISSDVTNRY